LALGITAPEGSVTRPAKLDSPTCARTTRGSINKQHVRKKNFNDFIMRHSKPSEMLLDSVFDHHARSAADPETLRSGHGLVAARRFAG
jgi:hypothetical protein